MDENKKQLANDLFNAILGVTGAMNDTNHDWSHVEVDQSDPDDIYVQIDEFHNTLVKMESDMQVVLQKIVKDLQGQK